MLSVVCPKFAKQVCIQEIKMKNIEEKKKDATPDISISDLN